MLGETLSGLAIEAKRERKQQSKPPIPPKPSIVLPALKKTSATNQEVGQKSKKDKPKILPKSKNLGRADQKEEVNAKPRVVGVILKKSVKSKPEVSPKPENQDHRQSTQEAASKAIPKVEVVAMRKEVNRKMGSKVKALKEKFEQNQAKEKADVRSVESKATPAAQVDTGVKQDPTLSPKAASQSRSFPTENKRSAMNPITAKSDPKPPISKKPLLTHVSVKEITARFEGHGKK